jgi:stage V sporulation protein SpoVS
LEVTNDMSIIRVASNSSTPAVAGAIAGSYRDEREADVQAIGAGAVNQAVKAIIRAREYLAEEGRIIACEPSFVEVMIGEKTRTAVRVSLRPHPAPPNRPLDEEEAPVEVTPVDTGEREGEAYLLEEETAIGYTAADEDAAAITDEVDSYTDSEPIQEEFEQRQEMASSGREQMQDELEAYHAKSPELAAGDVDAAWDQANVGDELPGGTAPTPDQDVVDEIGEAMGIEYEDDEPLQTGEKLEERDRNRWELNPESAAETEPLPPLEEEAGDEEEEASS